jgi:Mg-chelatase subunit ChlD
LLLDGKTMRLRTLVLGAAVSTLGLVGACGSDGDAPAGTAAKGGTGQGGSAGKGGASAGSTAAASGSAGKGSGGTSSGGSSNLAGEAGQGGEIGQGGFQGCASTVQEARLTPANLLFVIDKSGSMECNPPEGDAVLGGRCENNPRKEDPSLPSKWEVTRDALATALDTLAMQPNVRAGVALFPKGTASNSCGVEVEPEIPIAPLDRAQRRAISDLLEDVTPRGLTPIAGATILSYAHLAAELRARKLAGNTFVVLLTDGAETCAERELDKLVETDVPNARLFNIRTFVIGAPGSEGARRLLSRIAYEGGTPTSDNCDHDASAPDVGDCHFDMTTSTDFAADLNDALLEISRTKILACEFNVPENPDGGGVNRNEVNVSYRRGDGSRTETIVNVPDQDCADAEGWQYSPDGTKIVLCGPVCERVQADPAGQVSIVLGCPTIKDVVK